MALSLSASETSAQHLTLGGLPSEPQWNAPTAPQTQASGDGEIFLTQTDSQEVKFSGTVCWDSELGYTADNSYWRIFDLQEYEEIEEAFEVRSVEIGMGEMGYDGAPEQLAEVALHTLEGDFRISNLTELGRTTFALSADMASSVVDAEISAGPLSKSTELVVEVSFPDCLVFEEGGCQFRPGANSAGGIYGGGWYAGDWFLTSETCDITEYPLSIPGWAFGVHWWVLNVRGVEAMITSTEPDAQAEAFDLNVYPNPFAETARLAFHLESGQEVKVAVADVLGREVTVLHDGLLGAGNHSFALDSASLSAGVYLARVVSASGTVSRTITRVGR